MLQPQSQRPYPEVTEGLPQTPQNITAELNDDSLIMADKLTVHNPTNIEEKRRA